MEIVMSEEQLLAQMPDSFKEMERESMEDRYPYEERPQIILEDEASRRFCTFSLLKAQKLSENQLEYALKEVCWVVTSLYPGSLLDAPRLAYCEGAVCGWFSFRVAGIEEELFHVMYILPVNGCMMLGTAGCALGDAEGKEQAMRIIKSLQLCEKKFSFEVKRKELYYRR